MADTTQRAGGRQPTQRVAGSEYNPVFEGAIPALPGAPLCPSATTDGLARLARANALATSQVVGLATGPGVPGESVVAQSQGILTLTEAQWETTVVGATGPLVRGSRYFLSVGFSAGRIVAGQTQTPGDFVVQVGIALSSTDLLIQLGRPHVVT